MEGTVVSRESGLSAHLKMASNLRQVDSIDTVRGRIRPYPSNMCWA